MCGSGASDEDIRRLLTPGAAADATAPPRIVAFSGAGLSAESGVPTFRDPHDPDALWARFDHTTLASQAGFQQDPDAVTAWYDWRRRLIAAAEPNAAHRALAQRADIVHVTQNVDNLIERAGGSAIHLHGNIAVDRCNSCHFREDIDMHEPAGLRACPLCRAPMRPDVVWFGEQLPTAAWERAVGACTHADVLLVIGTSGMVYPSAELVDVARANSACIIVCNTQESTSPSDYWLAGPAAERLPSVL
ncbi:MAG: Sir2 family NAD-dependent protein deacetylase [Phycisphaerales bacterium]